MTPKKQVSPAIRILRGERDASARATHLEAATRKFLVTTNERKYMSTKTNFKRVALVAIASLGFGVLSAVPSQAAISGLTITVVDGTAPLRSGSTTLVNADSTNAATITVAGLMTQATDTMVVNFYNSGANAVASTARLYWRDTTTADSRAPSTGNVTGVYAAATSNTSNTTTDSQTAAAATPRFTIDNASAGASGHRFNLQLDTVLASNGAGTYSYTFVVTQYSLNAGAYIVTDSQATVNIVVAAGAAASTTPSSAYTNAFIAATDVAVADAAIAPKLATASTTAAAYINVDIRNGSDTRTAQDTVTISIAGAGLLYDGSSYGTSLVGYQTGLKSYAIVPDGRAGTATVTIALSRTGQTFTKTQVFYAAAAATNTLVASIAHPVLAVGSNSKAVRVVAKDAGGNMYSGPLYLYASSAADALVAGTETPVECNYSTADSRHDCNVTATTAGTAKMKAINAATVALATATSNEITLTVSAATLSTVKLAFDKATYAPGEKAKLTVTPLDSAGKVLPTATYSALFASGGITSNYTLTGDTLTAVVYNVPASSSSTSIGAGSSYIGTTANAMTYWVFMPVNGGTVTVSATTGDSLPLANRKVVVTASATVTDSGAAALAAVTALATTVASLKTLITTLTNLVLKIQKKVKA